APTRLQKSKGRPDTSASWREASTQSEYAAKMMRAAARFLGDVGVNQNVSQYWAHRDWDKRFIAGDTRRQVHVSLLPDQDGELRGPNFLGKFSAERSNYAALVPPGTRWRDGVCESEPSEAPASDLGKPIRTGQGLARVRDWHGPKRISRPGPLTHGRGGRNG